MIRKATEDDFDAIMGIYAYAREFMKRTGNPTQWGDTHPPESAVRDDIVTGKGFVVEEGGNVCGVFHFCIGEDPTYRVIEGQWKNNDRYGTVHRVASNRPRRPSPMLGLLRAAGSQRAYRYASRQCRHATFIGKARLRTLWDYSRRRWKPTHRLSESGTSDIQHITGPLRGLRRR